MSSTQRDRAREMLTRMSHDCGTSLVECRAILSHPLVDPSADSSQALRDAARLGRTTAVRALLEDGRADPRACAALSVAAFYYRADVVKLLLEDGRARPHIDDLRQAVAGGHLDILLLLLEDGRVNIAAADEQAMFNALYILRSGGMPGLSVSLADAHSAVPPHVRLLHGVWARNPDAVRTALADPAAEPERDFNYALRKAAEGADVDVVRLLVADARVQLMLSVDFRSVYEAVEHGGLAVVAEMLQCTGGVVDTVSLGHHALTCAARYGKVDVVRYLLRHHPFDPSAMVDALFESDDMSWCTGHWTGVEADGMVHPDRARVGEHALRNAVIGCSAPIVAMLLHHHDLAIDPSFDNNVLLDRRLCEASRVPACRVLLASSRFRAPAQPIPVEDLARARELYLSAIEGELEAAGAASVALDAASLAYVMLSGVVAQHTLMLAHHADARFRQFFC